MIFTVVYLPAAENELAELCLPQSDRQAVADASNAIDRLLRVDAHLQGRPFFGQRILAVHPLAVIFSVSLDDHWFKLYKYKN